MSVDRQHTIAQPVTLEGRGLFGGHPVTARFEPAPADHGIVFVRSDLEGARIPARVEHVVCRERRTSLQNGEAEVDTCEHCLSALAALRIDNVTIELDGSELPAGDGSAQPFVERLMEAGINPDGDASRHRFKLTEPVVVRDGDAVLAAVPNDEPALDVIYDLDYGETAIGRQVFTFNDHDDDYPKQLAPARTFVLQEEIEALRASGYGTHLTEQDVLVIGPSGPVGNSWRFANEPVRHKVVDLIGDLYLLGAPLQARITAHRSGHSLNHALVRELVRLHRAQYRHDLIQSRTTVDIRALMRMMPHRYPMLLVDRVIRIENDRHILGLKNVTINEPFFQGHYPGTPVMPGVLVVEAMAQLSGVLIGQTLEHTGKLAVLWSIDKVKLRAPVEPGDQLRIEVETQRMKGEMAQVKALGLVSGKTVCEAVLTFTMVQP